MKQDPLPGAQTHLHPSWRRLLKEVTQCTPYNGALRAAGGGTEQIHGSWIISGYCSLQAELKPKEHSQQRTNHSPGTPWPPLQTKAMMLHHGNYILRTEDLAPRLLLHTWGHKERLNGVSSDSICLHKNSSEPYTSSSSPSSNPLITNANTVHSQDGAGGVHCCVGYGVSPYNRYSERSRGHSSGVTYSLTVGKTYKGHFITQINLMAPKSQEMRLAGWKR